MLGKYCFPAEEYFSPLITVFKNEDYVLKSNSNLYFLVIPSFLVVDNPNLSK